jgi:hypothetical protein
VKQSRNIGTAPFDRLSAVDCRNEQDRGAKIQYREKFCLQCRHATL